MIEIFLIPLTLWLIIISIFIYLFEKQLNIQKELLYLFKQNNRDIGHIYCKHSDQDFECPKVRVKK